MAPTCPTDADRVSAAVPDADADANLVTKTNTDDDMSAAPLARTYPTDTDRVPAAVPDADADSIPDLFPVVAVADSVSGLMPDDSFPD